MFVYKYKQKGRTYAEVCKSSRDPVTKQPRRHVVRSLGRVIDFDKMLFHSVALGTYHYNVENDTCEPVKSDEIVELEDGRRKPPPLTLDFGNTYVIDHLIKQSNLDTCINAARCRRPEALYALINYYVLEREPNSRAEEWYIGNVARLIYPGASLSSQVVSTLIGELGDEALQQRFFKEYLQYCLHLEKPATSVLIDSTGLPNSIHFPLTAISNHNGKLSNEVRLIYVVDQNTGLPVYFRYVAGNIIDVSTLTATIAELSRQGLKPQFLILDAGYYSSEGFESLMQQDIAFVTRAGYGLKLYKDLMKEHVPGLRDRKYLTQYNGRLIYIKKVPCKLCGRAIFGYVCLDVAGYNDISRNIDEAVKAGKISLNSAHERLEEAGYFLILSSKDVHPALIMTTYYTRQSVEQIFDLAKNYANMEPVRVHDEQHLRGHLFVAFIATVILRLLQMSALRASRNMLDMLYGLRNQKCIVYDDGGIVITEPTKKANYCYKMFNMRSPVSIDSSALRSQNLPH